MIRLGGLLEGALESGILGQLLAIDLEGQIPGLLVAQTASLRERHVALDEG
jgi:hypothetical protein